MKSAVRSWILGAAIACLGLDAWAAKDIIGDPHTPIEQYRMATIVKLGQCHYLRVAAERLAQQGQAPDADTDPQACIQALRTQAPKALALALKATTRKGLQQALRTYHQVYMTGVAGFARLPQEAEDDYQSRQIELVNATNTAWFEVESNR